MKEHIPLITFVLAEIAISTFIVSTTSSMPNNIASHFNDAGVPNDFMSGKGYVGFMLSLAIGIPVLIALPIFLGLKPIVNNINIPNRKYWLSPQNYPSTLKSFKSQMLILSAIISFFVAYMHWIVLKANSVQPAKLPSVEFFTGIGILVISILAWALWFTLKYMKVPKT